VRTGWPWVLDGLKTVIETGRSLPPRAADPDGPADAPHTVDGDWHRSQAVSTHQETWELLNRATRTRDEDADLVACAFASAYHWARATGRTVANAARGDYLIAKALLAVGRPEAALDWADRCLLTCRDHGLDGFDLAYALEIRARSLRALDRTEEAEVDWAAALAVPIIGPEDEEWFNRDVRDGLAPPAEVGPASR
jgi:tetratricopeptide (TPR) repeat protein